MGIQLKGLDILTVNHLRKWFLVEPEVNSRETKHRPVEPEENWVPRHRYRLATLPGVR